MKSVIKIYIYIFILGNFEKYFCVMFSKSMQKQAANITDTQSENNLLARSMCMCVCVFRCVCVLLLAAKFLEISGCRTTFSSSSSSSFFSWLIRDNDGDLLLIIAARPHQIRSSLYFSSPSDRKEGGGLKTEACREGWLGGLGKKRRRTCSCSGEKNTRPGFRRQIKAASCRTESLGRQDF